MEIALSVRENPLWVVPYTTIAEDYQDLLDDFDSYAQVYCTSNSTFRCDNYAQSIWSAHYTAHLRPVKSSFIQRDTALKVKEQCKTSNVTLLYVLTARIYPCLQSAENLLNTIYQNFKVSLAQKISSSTGSVKSLTDKGSSAKAVAPTATLGCGRDSGGNARFVFVVSYDNITKEEDGVEARRRLLTTPCSATDGTTVSLVQGVSALQLSPACLACERP